MSFLKPFVILIKIFILISGFAVSQNTYQYRVFTQEDGLASGTLKGIKQDSTGFLWLLSENGLSRFDGYSFKNFYQTPNDKSSLPSSILYNMLIDNNKSIYFVAENSISRYVPFSFETIVHYNHINDIAAYLIRPEGCWLINTTGLQLTDIKTKKTKRFPFTSGFTLKRPYSFNELAGRFWFSDNKTILCFNPETGLFESVSLSYLDTVKNHSLNRPLLFFKMNKNETCFYSGDGLFKYDKKINSFIQFSKVSIANILGNSIKKIFIFNEKYLVFVFQTNTLKAINLKDEKILSISLKDPLFSSDEPVKIFETIPSYNGTLWVSTSNAGIFRLDFNKECYIEHLYHNENNANSLASNNIEFLLENHDVLWMSSPGIGLLKAERDKPIFSSYHPGNKNNFPKTSYTTNVRALNELDKNNLLIGTLSGLFQFNKITHQFSPVPSPIDGKPVLDNRPISAIIKDANNNIWISDWGRSGITLLNYEKKNQFSFTPYNDSISPEFNSIRCMFIDTHDFLWLGTDNNIIYRINIKLIDFSKNKQVFEKFEGKVNGSDPLIFNIVFTFSENKNGQVLIGSEGGMYIYDYSTNKFTRYSSDSSSKNSISNDNVRSFCNDKNGNLWVGTNGGGLNLRNALSEKFTCFNTENGLPDNSIYTIEEDKNGNLWMGTNRGICFFNPRTHYIRNYSLKDGIQNFEFNTNAAFKTSAGEMVMGGINGFNIFYPDSSGTISSEIPKVVISEFKVNDKDFPVADNINLNYRQNSVSFQFAALSYFRSRDNFYAYKLDGVNKDWVYCERRRFSNYAGLSPGKYTFHIKACNFNGIWNEEGASLSFTIAPPYWNTWWFRMIIILIIAGLIYLLFRYRLKQRLDVELLRNKIARDLHDEIGSNLSSISLFSAVAKEKTAETKVAPLLQKISDYTQTSQEAMNDIVWMINANNDTFEKIIVRMRKLAAEMIETKNIELHLSFDERLGRHKLSMDKRKNLYLIYKEALNNALKYSSCKNVWIDLFQQNNKIILKIRDDGMGFDLNAKIHGNGLINMKARAKELNGILQLLSNPGSGTTIMLEIIN